MNAFTEQMEKDLFEYGRRCGFGRWWNRAVKARPRLAARFARGHSISESIPSEAESSEKSTSPWGKWQGYVSEVSRGAGILDPACNRTMMGDRRLRVLQRLPKQHNLEIMVEETQ